MMENPEDFDINKVEEVPEEVALRGLLITCLVRLPCHTVCFLRNRLNMTFFQ